MDIKIVETFGKSIDKYLILRKFFYRYVSYVSVYCSRNVKLSNQSFRKINGMTVKIISNIVIIKE